MWPWCQRSKRPAGLHFTGPAGPAFYRSRFSYVQKCFVNHWLLMEDGITWAMYNVGRICWYSFRDLFAFHYNMYYLLQKTANTAWKISQGSKALKQCIADRSVEDFQRKFVLVLPEISMHEGHSVGEVSTSHGFWMPFSTRGWVNVWLLWEASKKHLTCQSIIASCLIIK